MKDKTFIIAEAGINHNGSLALAKKLIDAGLSFLWTCNVESKWGHIIQGQEMKEPSSISALENPMVLIAVSGPQDQLDLERQLKAQGLEKGISYYFFC